MFTNSRIYRAVPVGMIMLLCLAGCPPVKYDLEVLVTGQGAVTLNPSGGTYDADTAVTLTPTPAAGWHFDHWSGALSGAASPAQVTMDADKTVTVVFAINQFALTVFTTGQGMVIPDIPSTTFDPGTVVTLTPEPATGWHFDHWEGDLSGGTSPAPLTMNSAKTVTAVFVINQYALNTAVTGQGGITLNPPGGAYDFGTTVTLTPAPAAGWQFDHWEGVLSGSASPEQVTMDAAKTVTAVFIAIVNQYALTVSTTGQGTVTLNPPGGVYDADTVVSLTPAPAAGWHFDRWEGDLSGGATFQQLTMDAAKAVTAVFAQDEYTLDISPQGGGSVTLNPPGGTYLSGTVVTLTPVPDAASRFEIWGGELAGTKRPITITMDADKYVEAYFADTTYVSFNPNYLCAVGSTLYFLASTPHTGHELWKSDGTFEGTSLVRDITRGSDSGYLQFLVEMGGSLFFFAAQDSHYGLWTSDGTEEGTVEVANLGGWCTQVPPMVIDDTLYFSAVSTEGSALWKSDGTAEGTIMVKTFGIGPDAPYGDTPGRLTDACGVLYFNTTLLGVNPSMTIWRSDGTNAGTLPVFTNRYIDEITCLNGQVLFYSGTDSANGLWTTDGTNAGTVALGSFDFGPGEFTISGGKLFFEAQWHFVDTQVWVCDGVSSHKVHDSDHSSYRNWELTDFNGTLFYKGLYIVEGDGQAHCGLFKTTGSGESLVKEINKNKYYSVVSDDVVLEDTLYFAAENYDAKEPPDSTTSHGVGLWKSDGTTSGTVMVSEIDPVIGVPAELTAANGMVFFSATDTAHGLQLWKSDGTTAGTLPISCPTP